MIRSYKFRLYPTELQTKVMNETLETCRRLYNDSLGERSADWDVGFFGQKQLLTLRKQDNKYYKRVHSQVLQDVLLRLDKAYQAFFKKMMKYPRFKRREKYNSFTYPQYGGFMVKGNKLVLSHIGAIKFRMHRIPVGTMKRCTVIRDVDQWYCCITTDDGGNEKRHAHTIKVDTSDAVGIDVGLSNWLTMSDGRVIDNHVPNFKALVKKIRQLQRNIARRQKGSKNREKARIQLAKAWRKVRRCRDDHVHKTSRSIERRGYTLVVLEKLNIANMVKNHNLAAAIMDATWGKLRQMTAYKVERRGGQVVLVNPSGTSQKCSRCGHVVGKNLSVRMHECPSCGLVIDRDHNAALNILKRGLEQTHAETEPLLVRRISKFQSRKQEAHKFIRG